MNRTRWLSASYLICSLLLSSCATTPTGGGGVGQTSSYGPLTFNRAGGGDFYVAQNGRFVPAEFRDGAIEIHLRGAPFQMGYNGEQLNLCLAEINFPEVRPDPKGNRASCLSGPFTGARPPQSAALLVYSGSKWSDGNTELSDTTSLAAKPVKGYRAAYQINSMLFISTPEHKLGQFKGTLYGYLVVYRVHERRNQDIMPIRMIFD
jgi:predicted small secreted protein